MLFSWCWYVFDGLQLVCHATRREVGDPVKLDGLKGRADLNGQYGMCQGSAVDGRVEVVTSGGETVKVKVAEALHTRTRVR